MAMMTKVAGQITKEAVQTETTTESASLDERVAKLEKVLGALLNSYNGQIKAARVGAEPWNPSMAEVEGL